MQQEYIDTSKYQISSYSIDSRFCDLKTADSSEFRVKLPFVLKNIIRLRVTSVEVPLAEPIISIKKGNTSFSVQFNGSGTFTKSGNLPEGNYTAQELVSAFQILITPIYSHCFIRSRCGIASCERVY